MAGSGGRCHWSAKPDRLQAALSGLLRFGSRRTTDGVLGPLAGLEQVALKRFDDVAGGARLALLALPKKVATAVPVDLTGAGGAIAVGEGDGTLEHVDRTKRWVLRTPQVKQFDDEALVVSGLTGPSAISATTKTYICSSRLIETL